MTTDRNQFEYWKQFADERWCETMSMIHKGKDLELAMKESFGYLLADDFRLQNSNGSDFKRLVNGWLSNKRPEKTTAQKWKIK